MRFTESRHLVNSNRAASVPFLQLSLLPEPFAVFHAKSTVLHPSAPFWSPQGMAERSHTFGVVEMQEKLQNLS